MPVYRGTVASVFGVEVLCLQVVLVAVGKS